jgi:hypothetical protein
MLSATLRCGNNPACWITYPIVRRSATASVVRTSVPSTRTSPSSGSISRFTIFTSVVLPLPDSPSTATSSPGAIRSDTLRTAQASPYRFETEAKSITR